jgi:hypothetical protein
LMTPQSSPFGEKMGMAGKRRRLSDLIPAP